MSSQKLLVFLSLVLLTSCSIMKVNPNFQTQPSTSTREYDVIVVGAGIAGITAASELVGHGYKVVVLEANDYYGGRMKTMDIKGRSGINYTFELGANWIHGNSPINPINEVVKEVPNVKLFDADYNNTETFGENGERVDEKLLHAEETIISALKNCKECTEATSIEEAIRMSSPEYLKDKYIRFNLASDLEFETSGTINQISAKSDDKQIDGPQTLVLSGYQRFVEAIAKRHDVEIQLNHQVTQITYKNSKNTIRCKNGKTFKSKRVIIAVPLGVLKANRIRFSPSLPNWKNEAIAALGFGNLCKILLDFDNSDFVSSDFYYFGLVSENIKKSGLGTFYVNFKSVAHVPALLTFGLGFNADEAEKIPEPKLKAYLAKRISNMTKSKVKASDFSLYRSEWRKNPNFKGAYTYASTSTVSSHWESMAKPVFNNEWYFAGEHTIDTYRGTVHGAYMTGKQVAANIIDKKNSTTWEYAFN